MNATMLAVNLVAVLLLMSAAFVAARLRRRLDTVDIAWGMGFILVAWLSVLQKDTAANTLIAVLVTIWGLRLATHIYTRSKGKKDDPRYKELSDKWRGSFWLRAYVSIFMIQGVLVWLVSLPVMAASGEASDATRWLLPVGAVIWLAGFIFEAIADKQLADFKRLSHDQKVLQTGLWRYSRHPNYFGELVQWWGIGCIALHAAHGWVGLAGPFTLTILIVFVSGIPPIERRHRDDPVYRGYRRRTSVLIPWHPRA